MPCSRLFLCVFVQAKLCYQLCVLAAYQKPWLEFEYIAVTKSTSQSHIAIALKHDSNGFAIPDFRVQFLNNCLCSILKGKD